MESEYLQVFQGFRVLVREFDKFEPLEFDICKLIGGLLVLVLCSTLLFSLFPMEVAPTRLSLHAWLKTES